MSMLNARRIRIGKNWKPVPNLVIVKSFRRFDDAHPELPTEKIVEITARYHGITFQQTIKALWGHK